MYTISQLQEIITKEITALNFEKEPEGLYGPIEYTLASGGKRIRPALALAACNLFSADIEKAIPVALAFEVFHNFTLLHDDIMDNSPIRRNKPTVHKKWDSNTAILSGDAMMIKAYELLSELPAERLKKILPLFNQTALEVCEGQQYDMNFEKYDKVTEEEYINMIKLKTSVLIAGALKAGAIVGGADDKDADLLYEFGLNLGLAFQIQDDLLDTYGETSVFGKKTGNDIITGKKTFLLIKASEKADSETSKKLSRLISENNIIEHEKIKLVIEIYNKLNIRNLTESAIKEFYKNAYNSLNTLTVENNKKQLLSALADLIINRKK